MIPCLIILYKLQVLADKLPDVLDFQKDLVNLEAASKVLQILLEGFGSALIFLLASNYVRKTNF